MIEFIASIFGLTSFAAFFIGLARLVRAKARREDTYRWRATMATSFLVLMLATALTPTNAEKSSTGTTNQGHALADAVTPIKNKASDAKAAQEEKAAAERAAREEEERREREAAELAERQEAERQAQEAAELAARQEEARAAAEEAARREEEARIAAEEAARQAEADRNNRTVYITQTGTHYHFDRYCRGLSRAKSVSEDTLGNVIGWLDPCSYCAY